MSSNLAYARRCLLEVHHQTLAIAYDPSRHEEHDRYYAEVVPQLDRIEVAIEHWAPELNDILSRLRNSSLQFWSALRARASQEQLVDAARLAAAAAVELHRDLLASRYYPTSSSGH